MRVPSFDMPRAEIRAELDRLRHPMRVAIDRAKNPFNVGAIIRTAALVPAAGDRPRRNRALVRARRDGNAALRERRRSAVDRGVPRAGPSPSAGSSCASRRTLAKVVGLWDAELPEDARARLRQRGRRRRALRSWKPPTRSSPSRCTASITATRSRSRRASRSRSGRAVATKTAASVVPRADPRIELAASEPVSTTLAALPFWWV